MLTYCEIVDRLKLLAAQVDVDYSNVGRLHMIGVLPEAYQLVCDLSRLLKTPHSLDFAISIGEPVFPLTRRRYLRNGLREPTHRRDVLVVATKVDSDRIVYDIYSEILCRENPDTVRLLALLYFVEQCELNPKPKYVGFPIKGNPQLNGYGLKPECWKPDIERFDIEKIK